MTTSSQRTPTNAAMKAISFVLLASSAAQQSGVSATCVYDGDMEAASETVMRHVGYQCLPADESTGKSAGFFGDEEVCNPDGTVSRNKLAVPYTCEDGTFCDMCGPSRRGAAQCVSSTFAEQGIQCDFASNYKASGCFTFDANQTVVPANTQIGSKTIVGCTSDGKLEEVYINCNSNWFHEFQSESVSCPDDAPICKDEGGSASCHPDEMTPVYVTTDAPDGADDGCVVGGRFYSPGETVKSERLECLSDTMVITLVQKCQSGGGVVGVSEDMECPVGIRPKCHQCGSFATCLGEGVDSPSDCISGADHVSPDAGSSAGTDPTTTTTSGGDTGSGTAAAAGGGAVMCIDGNGKAFAVGAEMERIGFKCTGGSIVEGKVIMCGSDGNPTKDASLVAFDCPTSCYQCGSSSPGAAVCADSPQDPALQSFTVDCELVDNNPPSNQKTSTPQGATAASPATMASLSMPGLTLCAVLASAAMSM